MEALLKKDGRQTVWRLAAKSIADLTATTVTLVSPMDWIKNRKNCLLSSLLSHCLLIVDLIVICTDFCTKSPKKVKRRAFMEIFGISD